MDALRKGDQLFVGDVLLNVFEVVSHFQDGLNKASGQQTGHDGCGSHHQHTAQHDGGQGGVVDGPDGFGVLCHAEDIAVGQEHGVIIRLIAHGLGIAAVAADALLHGLLNFRAGQVIFHLLRGGGFEQHRAVRCDQRDAQIRADVGSQLVRRVDLLTPGGDQMGFVFQRGPCLFPECLVEHEDAERGGADQADKAHQKQPVTDFFFHAPWFHSSFSSSLSASL